MATTNKYSNVPPQLKSYPNWVVWRLETRKGKSTKVPYSAKIEGKFAKSNDPTTWATFDDAVAASSDMLGDYDGIGFMLQGTSYVGIDFDSVVDDDKSEPYVLAILELLGNPYHEITPSGRGLRAFVECDTLPKGQRKFSANKYGAEIYIGNEGGRYLTITGNQFSGDGIPKIEDISIPYFLISQIRDDKFKRLWLGDASDFGGDQSRADLGLLALLSRKLNTQDREIIERYFEASVPGHREKWIERQDYRDRTFAKLLKSEKPQQTDHDYWTESLDGPQPELSPVIRNGDEVKTKHIDWFWRNRVALGKITLFVGNPDNGKSLASAALAAICTTGGQFPDEVENTTPPSKVFMLVGEDDIDDTVIPRLKIAGADVSKIAFMEGMKEKESETCDRGVRLDQDIKAIEKHLVANPSVRLVIIDPISNYLGNTKMNAEQDIRGQILIPLKNLAAKFNVAVVLVMHLNKKNDLDAISRIGGAMAFVGVARSSWLFIRDQMEEVPEGTVKSEQTYSMLRVKNNLARVDKSGLQFVIDAKPFSFDDGITDSVPVLRFTGSTEQSADDALESRGHGRERGPGRPKGTDTKMQDARQFILERLQNGEEVLASDIKSDAHELKNIKPETLRLAADALNIHRAKKGRVWYWRLRPVSAGTSVQTTAETEFSL